MGVNHKEIVISDYGVPAASLCTAMNVHVFAEDVAGADCKTGVLTPELKILRLETNGTEWKEMIVFANRCWPFHDHVRFEPAAVSDCYAIADATVRADEYVGADLCFGADDCRVANHKRRFRNSDFGMRIWQAENSAVRGRKSEFRNPNS